MDKIISVTGGNPQTVAAEIARRVKERRLEMNLTQDGLATRAGLKLPTYRNFERTGAISLKGVLQIAFAMNMLQDFEQLFVHRQYQSIDELLSEQTTNRKRGSKR